MYDGDVVSFDGQELRIENKSMYIESLELKNFRNYEDLSIVLDPGTNILYGDNAQERRTFSRPSIFAEPQNRTGEARIKR